MLNHATFDARIVPVLPTDEYGRTLVVDEKSSTDAGRNVASIEIKMLGRTIKKMV